MRFLLLICLPVFWLCGYGEYSTPVVEQSFVSEHVETVPPDTLIKMERTVCFGTCPAYELIIAENGEVFFTGKDFVAHKGSAKGKISQDDIDGLIHMIKKSGFMDFPSRPECETRMTDHPSVFLTVEMDEMRNSVTHYHGCKGFSFEEELYELEEAIDSLADVNRWVKES